MKLELTLAAILAMGASAAARDPVQYPPYPPDPRPHMKTRHGTHIGHNGTDIYTNGTWCGSLVEHRFNKTGDWCGTPGPDAEYLAGHNGSSTHPHHNGTGAEEKVEYTTLMRVVAAATPAAKGDMEEK